LHASRLFRMLLPRAAGGDDAEPALYVAGELARHDASIAWNVLVANRSCLIAAYLEPAANQAVFADPRSTMQGLYAVGVAAVGFGIATCTRSRSRFRHAALDNKGKIVKQTKKVYTMMLFGTLNFSHAWYDPKGGVGPAEFADMVVDQFLQGVASSLVSRHLAISVSERR